MKWLGILLVCSVLAGCAAYGDVTESISRSIDPGAYKAYDRSVECQKKGGKACGG